MKEFVFQATDPHGRRVTGSVLARDASSALARLAAQGFVDVALHSDDITAQTRVRGSRRLNPLLYILLKNAGRTKRFAIRVRLAFAQFALLPVTGVAGIALRRGMGKAWTYVDGLLIALAAAPLLIAALRRTPASGYARMQVANLNADWSRMLELANELAPTLESLSAEGKLEAAYNRARALLGLGRRQEAFDELNALRAAPHVPLGRIRWRISNLCMADGDHAAAQRELEEAVEAEPNDPMLWLALADLYSTRLDQPEKARHALEQIRLTPMSPQTEDSINAIRAHIALCEGRYSEARPVLEAKVASLRKTEPNLPIARGLRHMIESSLVVACARMGDSTAAQRYYKQCAPFLKLHKSHLLLDRAENALRETDAATTAASARRP